MSLSSGKTVCNIQVSYYERVIIMIMRMIMRMIMNESLNRINPSVLESTVIIEVL